MPRIRTLAFDNLTLNLSPMSYKQATTYLDESREISILTKENPEEAKTKYDTKFWEDRQLKGVCAALNRAAGSDTFTPEKLVDDFDMVTLNLIYNTWLQISGLLPPSAQPGEARATSTGI